jgi:glucose/arabinose dehydrogenase
LWECGGARPEVWARGLRNPWRFSFDRLTDDLFIADVGEKRFEEIDFQPAASKGGENYGWSRMEGRHCFIPSTNCNPGGLVLPIIEYTHAFGCSITGGFVYRGNNIPRLQGTYLYGDFCSGRIWGARRGPARRWSVQQLDQTGFRITTFGEDEGGELYVGDSGGGRILKIVGLTP